jgi:hypothetical protein
MLDQRGARLLPQAGHDVQGPGRQADFGGQLGDAQHRQARVFRRLHDVGVKTGRAKGKVDQGAAVVLLESYLMWRAAR